MVRQLHIDFRHAECFVIGDSPEDVAPPDTSERADDWFGTGRATEPRVVEKAAPDASVAVNFAR
jgi:hypothetical protein